ncbi:MAG: 50S ribosomal protein L16 [Bdellovibrionales bacterium]|nr:50S ribosomal protein L16 [Bdellovibrionales bacterium]
MLSPKRVKRRKQFRPSLAGKAHTGSNVSFGDFGIQAAEAGRINARQIEASRIAISRSVKRGGKMWTRIFPHIPVTKKPAETRMGSGKGNPEFWEAIVYPGTVLFELGGVTPEQAKEAFRLAGHKLPVKTKFLARE